jgi:hypothetical protein
MPALPALLVPALPALGLPLPPLGFELPPVALGFPPVGFDVVPALVLLVPPVDCEIEPPAPTPLTAPFVLLSVAPLSVPSTQPSAENRLSAHTNTAIRRDECISTYTLRRVLRAR